MTSHFAENKRENNIVKSEMYTKHANKYALAVQDNLYNAHFERPNLQAMLGALTGLKVLDLGCGSGEYAQYLLEQGAEKVTCIDASREMITIVKNKLGERVSAYQQDLSKGVPDEKSHSADVIICPLVLHYIADLVPFFKDVARVLKTGGYMVFSTHHPFADFENTSHGNYFERELVKDVWDTIGEPIAVSFYRRSLTEIINAMTENGLVITQLSEGVVSDKIKEISPVTYQYLSTNPNFIFIKCLKI